MRHGHTLEFVSTDQIVIHWKRALLIKFGSFELIKNNTIQLTETLHTESRDIEFKENRQAFDNCGTSEYQGERERNKRQSPIFCSQRRPACIYKSFERLNSSVGRDFFPGTVSTIV